MTDTLLHRLENEEPSRELADEVLLAFGWVRTGVGLRTGTVYMRAPDGSRPDEKPNPLESLDAAMAMIPEPWKGNYTIEPDACWLRRLADNEEGVKEVQFVLMNRGGEHTALAVTGAAYKALKEGENE